jgi:hypothetical protein
MNWTASGIANRWIDLSCMHEEGSMMASRTTEGLRFPGMVNL